MGIIESAIRTAQETGPECPPALMPTFSKYRELKFTRRVMVDEIRMYARESLNWADLVAYSQITGQNISHHEADLIMGLDAIFEGRNDV